MKNKTPMKPLAAAAETDTVRPSSAALPNESPITITLDEAPEAEKMREEAFEGGYVWKGQELLPYTPSKRGTWERLCARDVPLPANVELTNLEAYAPQALKLLYLLTHKAEEYAPLRHQPEQFIAEIELWVDQTCGHGDLLAAVILALRVHNDQLKLIAVPKPSGKGGSLGN
jgi:hypothetical protein